MSHTDCMSSIPPKLFKRNEYGLLVEPSTPYVFNDDGSVNWRKMIRPEFLVPNKQKTQETDISKLEDKDLLILLGGIKELAHLRGFHSVCYDIHGASPVYVLARCRINWITNYESGDEVTFESIADASPDNTQSFGRNYLAAIAENRAFVRCVRNFLKINIVGQDEIGAKQIEDQVPDNPLSPSNVLLNLMREKSISFEKIKKQLAKDGYENAESLVTINDISKPKIFELIERIKAKS